MPLSLRDLENIVQEARRQGALGVEVLTSASKTCHTTTVRRGNSVVKRSEDELCTVSCWTDGGRMGQASGRHDQARELVTRALEAASSSSADVLEGPVGRLSGPARGLGIDDKRHDMLTDEDRIEVIVTNERAAARENPLIETGPFTFTDVREHRLFANSKGVLFEAWGTTYEATGSIRLRADKEPLELRDHVATRAFASTACLPYGQTLAGRGAALLVDGPPVDGPIRVLLPPRAAGRLFAALAPLFTNAHIVAQDTLLARAAEGRLFHKRIHLVDDGLLPGGLRTWPFDERGVPAIPLTLIREGLLDGRYIDVPTARAEEHQPTGHTHGGQLRPSNLQLNSGSRSIHAIMGDQSAPVFVVDDLPVLTGLDTRTGDMDVPVAGVIMQGHKRLGARRRAKLRGNVVDALRAVVAVSSDTDRIQHVDAPGLFIDGFVLTG